ncbi:MAG: hypothetical protein QGI05_03065 [Candidatus Omnitrophota bacterium]|jgi:hypothetical protein|nr:hypothetical protein [Candidatus Omnitrophota bacterium]
MKKIAILLLLLFLPITVFSQTIDEPKDIRPLKDPVEIAGGFPWLLLILVLLVAAGILAFIYFKKKKHAEITEEVAPRPPEEIAREELDALLAAGLIKKGMIKEHYIRLSDIIRRYIEARYKILTLDKTTWELYLEMRANKVKRKDIEEIRDFLENCDFVKFAKYIPTEKDHELSWNKAKEIIDTTTPKETSAI